MGWRNQVAQLAKEAWLFYKLATNALEDDQDPDQEEDPKAKYQRLLQVALRGESTLGFIKQYQNTDLLTPSDFQKLIDAFLDYGPTANIRRLEGASLRQIFADITYMLRDNQVSTLQEPILRRIIEKCFQCGRLFSASDYVAIEQYAWPYLSSEVRSRIHKQLMNHLLDLLSKIRNNDEEYDYERRLKDALEILIKSSYYFPRTLAESLIKRLGDPELYSDFIMSHLNRSGKYREHIGTDRPEDQLNHPNYQKKLSVFDVATWYRAYGREGAIKAADFIHLLSRCDEGARQYLRGFIYTTSPTLFDEKSQYFERIPRPANTFFMLGEDMHPMNDEYQAIGWPDHFYILKLDPYDMLYEPENKERWDKIFQDFKIIPHQKSYR